MIHKYEILSKFLEENKTSKEQRVFRVESIEYVLEYIFSYYVPTMHLLKSTAKFSYSLGQINEPTACIKLLSGLSIPLFIN